MISLLFNKALRRFYLDNKHLIIKAWQFIKDWRTLVSFLLAWLITNGWGYIFIILGNLLDIRWMLIVGTSYIAFLWMPFTPEKIITVPIALFFKKIFYKCK